LLDGSGEKAPFTDSDELSAIVNQHSVQKAQKEAGKIGPTRKRSDPQYHIPTQKEQNHGSGTISKSIARGKQIAESKGYKLIRS
jgi:hypothetical protein